VTVDVRLASAQEWDCWLADRTDRLTRRITDWYGGAKGAREEAERRLALVVRAGRLLALDADGPAPAGAGSADGAGAASTPIGAGSADGAESARTPAGFVAVSVRGATAGGVAGELHEVWVAPAWRRQGIGAAGLAAGLRWLAEQDCTKAMTTIDAADPASASLCREWTAAAQTMERVLGEPPVLPDGFSARPMVPAEFESWQAIAVDSFARALIATGALDEAAAWEKSANDNAALLPDGVATRNVSLSVLESDGRRVGSLWLAHHNPSTRSFVCNVQVEPPERGRGYGRAGMLAAERIVLAQGDRSIGLNVFSHNDVARGLYESLGYRVADRSFSRPLP